MFSSSSGDGGSWTSVAWRKSKEAEQPTERRPQPPIASSSQRDSPETQSLKIQTKTQALHGNNLNTMCHLQFVISKFKCSRLLTFIYYHITIVYITSIVSFIESTPDRVEEKRKDVENCDDDESWIRVTNRF